jgi:hypothetical protein
VLSYLYQGAFHRQGIILCGPTTRVCAVQSIAKERLIYTVYGAGQDVMLVVLKWAIAAIFHDMAACAPWVCRFLVFLLDETLTNKKSD